MWGERRRGENAQGARFWNLKHACSVQDYLKIKKRERNLPLPRRKFVQVLLYANFLALSTKTFKQSLRDTWHEQ